MAVELLGGTEQRVFDGMADAEAKAWEALSGYKFWMFGYHAARWINYSRLLPGRHPNPFRELVQIARTHTDGMEPTDE